MLSANITQRLTNDSSFEQERMITSHGTRIYKTITIGMDLFLIVLPEIDVELDTSTPTTVISDSDAVMSTI
jgi:hypothetical protein